MISGKAIGKMFRLSKPEMVVGRSGEADIMINDDAISRRHARFETMADDTVWIEDLGSKNGTYLEGERVTRVELHDGDRVLLGSSTILKLTYQDQIEEQFQKQLYESATRDDLTGLLNRKFLLERLSVEFAYCVRHKVTLSLCMFDIDHFKQINDRWGHVAGDAVLSQLGKLVRRITRPEDGVCRYGGEEFAVLLREIDSGNARLFAERIRARVEQADFSFKDENGRKQTIRITISVGVATVSETERYATVEELIAAADKLLYAAKQAGRNRVAPPS
ncbi:MAG TPA: GGDEF domain-containing protein [Myxococcaceae bacterium]|nr:GGDEF domain-containing protein [Myxococcaceae bacterium]